MADCPYCGEEVDDDATACWKCGAALGADTDAAEPPEEDSGAPALDADGDLAVPGDGPPGGGSDTTAKPKKFKECPHCEAMMPESARRCKECGRMLEEYGSAETGTEYKLGTIGVVLAVCLIAVVGILILARGRRGDYIKKEFAPYEFQQLDALIGRRSRGTDRLNWMDVSGKFVRWEGIITQKSGLTGTTLLVKIDPTNARFKDVPDVEVTFKDSSASAFDEGDKIRFDARLKEKKEITADGPIFVLDEAVVAPPEPPPPPEPEPEPEGEAAPEEPAEEGAGG